ncbi:MAG: hypothetical protein CMJ49_03800 [Planctomycetaceae bacterium]|nr:hypothetical protein [Planctomycetaceae bacterium]
MDFTGKTAVVTGGAVGMGGATTRAFLRDGANVAVLDIDDPAGQAAVADAGERGLFVHCDVAKTQEVDAAFAQVNATFGGVDYLINNAGIVSYNKVADTSEEEWDRTMDVNLKGAFLCARHALRSMEERGGGVVVNMGSVQSYVSQEKVAAYTTSKTAMLGLTRSIAVDYAPTIRSVTICPGTVDTPLLHNAAQLSPDPAAVVQECIDMHLLKRIGKPEEIAELILFVCSDKAPFITGQSIRIDGGLGIMVAGSKQD